MAHLNGESLGMTMISPISGYGAYQQQLLQQRVQPYAMYCPQNYGMLPQTYVNAGQSLMNPNYAFTQPGFIYPQQMYNTQLSAGIQQYLPAPQQYRSSINPPGVGMVPYTSAQA